LIYVSPKSGRAVCAEAGEPYKDKLFRLPDFYGEFDIADGLRLTGYFLEHRMLEAHHKQMPATRNRLAALLSRHMAAV
jgi:DNA repair protein RecO (recombination protein O)